MKIVLGLLGLLIVASATAPARAKLPMVCLLQRTRFRRSVQLRVHLVSTVHGDGERHWRVLPAEHHVSSAAWTAPPFTALRLPVLI
jgi:hypothetical protein